MGESSRDDSAILRRLSTIESALSELQDTVAKVVAKEIVEINAIRATLNGNAPPPTPSPKKEKKRRHVDSDSDSDSSSSSSSSRSSSSSSSSSSGSSSSDSDSSSDSSSSGEKLKIKKKEGKGKGKGGKGGQGGERRAPKKKRFNDEDGYGEEELGMETEYVPPAVLKTGGKGKKFKYKCSQCSATYSRKDALQRHALKHTGARPFQCPHCESAFRSSANLIVHVQRKHGTPRHACNLCQKRFVAPSLLRTHLGRAHRSMVTNLKLCSVCQYSSYDLFEFNAHLNSHPPPETPVHNPENDDEGDEEVPQDPEVLETAPLEGGEVPNGNAQIPQPVAQNGAQEVQTEVGIDQVPLQ